MPVAHAVPSCQVPTEFPLAAYATLASEAAARAAETLRAGMAQHRAVRARYGREVKVEADQTMNRLICQALRRATPFRILSEESGSGRGDQPPHAYWWIVDPLDGSANFARGIPWSCVSIALWRGLTPLVGVIHDVERAEQFEGVVGQGARLNGVPIHVSRVRTPGGAVLCTGFPTRRAYDARSLTRTVRQIQRYQKIRMLGSAALSLAYVACGRADVYEEERIALWDVAAGVAIVQAAGGCLQMSPPDAERTVSLRAGTPTLLGEDALRR